MKTLTRTVAIALISIASALAGAIAARSAPATEPLPLELGNFSVSLAVKDIRASRAFYEKLDFKEVGGNIDQNWIVLRNRNAKIGLFQGMFEKNILTFNPGWNEDKETLPHFQDVRELQRILKMRGVTLETEADEAGTGPGYFTLSDPDGNQILFDQHVPSPKR